ncbi:LysM peptidoglycan-binding domain-containing protein [Photobacterium profundum]|uniref:N-acetylmuramoyl-L-alanine amidase AmiC n=1 Tax=Photobacterium profundum 3TCK TaxID=314280 RepID=Q1YXJ5_9GAMM|nr:putative N-acetylmuramoyl-L-alanine amidase [Photobacterium profundum 3TCK]PSV57834.1 LysM peptidoglycan-binding domain-containing protein [Photobacterium profundum]
MVGLFSSIVAANELKGVRVWPAPDETRVVLDMKSEATYSYFTLTKPNRLVVDLKTTSLKTKLPVIVSDSAVLTKIRSSSAPDKGSFRLVFETKTGMTPKLFTLAPTPDGHYGYRLVLDLPHGKAASIAQKEKPPGKVTTNQQAQLPSGRDDIIIAIDPGHGGEDPGSIGPTRKYEKNVTLAVSKKVAAKINATSGMKAVMTRSSDYFVNLNKRSEIARKNKSHLLVSIHADGFTKPQPRGASVWVLNTRRANSEIGRWLEQQEKQSELLGGGDVLSGDNDDQYLSMAVLDLQFGNSTKEGYEVATNVLKEISKVTRLHKSKPEHASLAVLKSPDIPSLLVETGFITNPTEERLLNSSSHQNKLANAIYKGILAYFETNPPEGTLFASRKGGVKHKVTSGQSLSVIAKRYGVSISSIKSVNNLKSNNLHIGQVLIIPGSSASNTVRTSSISASSSPATVKKVVIHKVQRGDYLGKIASKYSVTMDSIRQLNNLKSDNVMVGQKLKVEVDAPKSISHKVKRGEFLGKIATSYGVSVDSIRNANKLKSDKLAVGQTLIIPRS